MQVVLEGVAKQGSKRRVIHLVARDVIALIVGEVSDCDAFHVHPGLTGGSRYPMCLFLVTARSHDT